MNVLEDLRHIPEYVRLLTNTFIWEDMVCLAFLHLIMKIRTAVLSDLPAIQKLLRELDYTLDDATLFMKLQHMLRDNDESLIVCEEDDHVIAFMSIHIIPQIALAGDFARISYFSVLPAARNKGVGKQLEAYCLSIAAKRNCDRIEVHCHERRIAAHEFYRKQGYVESPRYYIKLVNG